MEKVFLIAVWYGIGTMTGSSAISFFRDGRVELAVVCSIVAVASVSLVVMGCIKLAFPTGK